jgi:glycosyltransferase involved in cell wall biosynthesis
MSRVTFSLCTRGSAVSKTYLDWAIRRGRRLDRDSFKYYYLGARNDEFHVHSVPAVTNSIALLFAGQFGFSYDIELILDAAQAFAASGREDIRFVLCGAGEKQEQIAVRARSLPNVELHGWLSPTELNSIGARCQVGLCTYRSSATQSLPTKLFDYFSMGLYVISSLSGEAETLLKSHSVGRSYVAGNLQSFMECILAVRSEVDLGPNGRAAIRQSFDKYFDSSVIYRGMVDELILPLAWRSHVQ